MKKIAALLTTVMILAGSVGMAASAAGDSSVCSHTNVRNEKVDDYIETYTHSVRVGTSADGKPTYALCLAEIGWQRYRNVCSQCHKELGSYSTKVYEVHSMH